MKTAVHHNRPIILGIFSLVLLIGVILTWAAYANISGAIIGTGVIQVDESKQVISHQLGGTVSDIYVSNGDHVDSGEKLFSLDDKTLQSKLSIIEGELFELLAKEARLTSEVNFDKPILAEGALKEFLEQYPSIQKRIDRQNDQFRSNMLSVIGAQRLLENKIEQIKKQLMGIEAQIIAKEKQIILVEKDIQNGEKLLKEGLITASSLSQNEKLKSIYEGEFGALFAQSAQLREQIIANEIDKTTTEEKRKNLVISELIKLQPIKETLFEKRKATLMEISRLTIRSPIKGRVHDSKLSGLLSVIKPGDAIMRIVPDNRPTIVSVKVDARDIEHVHIGQASLLRFKSFNPRSTPMIEGRVTGISPDIFIDHSRKAFYAIQLEITRIGLERLGDRVLVQGMPVDGFIITQDYTPLDYLTSPLKNYFSKAFR